MERLRLLDNRKRPACDAHYVARTCTAGRPGVTALPLGACVETDLVVKA